METFCCPSDLQVRRSLQSIQLLAHLYCPSASQNSRACRAATALLLSIQQSPSLSDPARFPPRHSTETALVSVADRILAASDRGEISLLCLIDLSKCFDVIDHAILLTKLSQYGVDTSWFASYLSGHTQTVSFTDKSRKRHFSKSLPKNIRVFQGSSLGPLLYCLFANDLSLFAATSDITQYADNTQVLVSGKKSALPALISQMESNLATLDSWFGANSLKVNANKTQLIVFGSRQNLRSISLSEVSVTFRGVLRCGLAPRSRTSV